MTTETFGLRAEDAARLIGIGRTHFLVLHRSGRVPKPRRLGRAVLWDRDELRAWFAAGCPERSKWETIRQNAIV